MAQHVVTAMLLVVALIHWLPLSGVLGAARLRALYGLSFDEPNLAILMRHRAVLFGLLGVFLACAAFQTALHAVALGAAAVSVGSFLCLAWSVGGYNALVGRVVKADVVALVCVAIGAVAQVMSQGKVAW